MMQLVKEIGYKAQIKLTKNNGQRDTYNILKKSANKEMPSTIRQKNSFFTHPRQL